jgi:CheY-like chemotaxis protein
MLDGNDGPQARATPRTPCILVVEDEDLVRDLAMRVLSLHGYRVLCAENGRIAVDMFAEHGSEVDLVLLDLTMPGLNGAQVFAAIVAQKPDARVLITSGYSEDEGRELLGHPAVTGFLAKPYRIDALVERVQSSIAAHAR